ncbi:MAG: hypothetical protein ACOZQL_16545 [Myxococcota bacterium]
MRRSLVTIVGLIALSACEWNVPIQRVKPPEPDDGLIHRATPPEFGTVGDAGGFANPAAVLFENRVHVFAQHLGSRTLSWCGDALQGCEWQVLDGAGGLSGRVQGVVASECIAAASWGGELHVFYRQDESSRRTLRHGVYSNHRWQFETMTAPATTAGCAATLVDRVLRVAAHDDASGALRLTTNDTFVWALDAVIANGQDVGRQSALTSTAGLLHVFYSDDDRNALVEANPGEKKVRESFDAPLGRLAATATGGTAHVFLQDPARRRLLHGISPDKGSWELETIDGNGARPGATTNDVGSSGIAATDALEIFYYDATAGDLRHARPSEDGGWRFERLDGETEDVGRSPTALRLDAGVVVIYEGAEGTVRRAWLAE